MAMVVQLAIGLIFIYFIGRMTTLPPLSAGLLIMSVLAARSIIVTSSEEVKFLRIFDFFVVIVFLLIMILYSNRVLEIPWHLASKCLVHGVRGH